MEKMVLRFVESLQKKEVIKKVSSKCEDSFYGAGE